MARLWYGGSPADFVIGQGAQAEMLDAAEAPLVPQRFGRAALLPLTADTFDLFEPDMVTPVTDLLNAAGAPITQITSQTDFADRATFERFQGPDGYEYDLYASADGVTFYRFDPSTDSLFDRVGTAETALTDLATTDLSDFSDTAPTEGQIPVFNQTSGQWEPGAAVGTGTVTSVATVAPDGAGNVPLTPGDISAATAADMAILKQRVYVHLAYTGSGYEAKPAGFAKAIRIGPVQPSSQVAEGDIWLQPEAS